MKNITLFDCTLRDGANAVEGGFTEKQAVQILEALLRHHIKAIEIGGAKGLGGQTSPGQLTGLDYMKLAQPYLKQGYIGIFLNIRNAVSENIRLAAGHGMKFVRIGANAGDGFKCYEAIQEVKKHGMSCEYSLMKSYVLPPKELAAEAKNLASCGLDRITLMDSAGTMLPDDVKAYVGALRSCVDIPVAFHGHNNLGMSYANALAAVEAGADTLDCGLLGMARSAGNGATEVLCGLLKRLGYLKEVDLFGLLSYLDTSLIPEMRQTGYNIPILPLELICGLYGCHSNSLAMFQSIASSLGVPLYELIARVSNIDRKNPDQELIEAEAVRIASAAIR